MSAAAPPPTPLKAATICGIAVIFTRRAAGTPMTDADRHRADDEREAGQARGGEGDADGERHAAGADEVAARAPSSGWRGPSGPG